MIIDVHYHQSGPLPAEENVAKNLVEWLLTDFTRLGINKTVDEVMPMYRDYCDDVECNKLIWRMDEAGIDVTVINIVDIIERGMDNETTMLRNKEISQKAAKAC